MDLYGETFSDLRLQGDTFSSGVVEDCLFTRCRFQEVTLENFQVTGCQFVDCTFAGLHYKNMSCLNNAFQHCALSGVEWSALLDPRKLDLGFLPFESFSQCVLHHNVFYSLDLQKFDFHGCDLTGSSFDECDLRQADFSGCALSGTIFSHNDLRGADFRRASGYSLSLETNQGRGARFSLPEHRPGGVTSVLTFPPPGGKIVPRNFHHRTPGGAFPRGLRHAQNKRRERP